MAGRSESWEELIEQVHSAPVAVIETATQLLTSNLTPRAEIPGLHWARGLALRESGEIVAAQQDFATGVKLSQSGGGAELSARIAVSWSIVEMSLGDAVLAHRLLDEAEPALGGRDLGRLLMQRGLLNHRAGDLSAAIDNYQRALPITADADDRLAEVRLQLNLGLLLGQSGDPAAGAEYLAAAKDAATRLGFDQLAAMAAHNLGYTNALLGRTPEALADYSMAEDRYRALNDHAHLAVLGSDRAALYAQAGLHEEAHDEAQRVLATVEASGNVLDLAEAELVAARAAMSAGKFATALDASTRARGRFADNGRDSWAALARYVGFMAGIKDLEPAVRLSKQATEIAGELESFGWAAEAVHIRVEAAGQLIEGSDNAAALRLLDSVAPPRRGLPVVDGIAAWTALAMRCLVREDLAGTRRAVTRGLNLVESNALTIEALDLRAHVIDQGRSLAEIGARVAFASGRPREFLKRIESGRAASVRTVNLPDDAREAIAESLAALRALESERMNLVAAGEPTEQIDRSRSQAESEVRSRRRRLTGSESRSALLVDCIAQLGPACFVGFEDVSGGTSAASIVGGRTKLHIVNRQEADEASDAVVFALNRLARRRASEASTASALEMMKLAATSLSSIIPGRARQSPESLVVSPSASMAGYAWRVIAGAQGRPLAVAPSLTAWALANRHVRGSNRSALIVSGPGLDHADREVDLLLGVSTNGVAIRSRESSIAHVLNCLEGVDVAHFACHGNFRADNPMFSSLRLADGDLTIYDLEQCERLPHTIVMSACNAGQNAVLRGGALLGMTSALIQLGVSSVIAPLTPVNDERSVDLMVRLHTHLAAGIPAAEALAKASIGPDGELDPTAAPFICFGS